MIKPKCKCMKMADGVCMCELVGEDKMLARIIEWSKTNLMYSDHAKLVKKFQVFR